MQRNIIKVTEVTLSPSTYRKESAGLKTHRPIASFSNSLPVQQVLPETQCVFVRLLSQDASVEFTENHFKPYLFELFKDLVLRSEPPTRNQLFNSVDKNTFIEYCGLPLLLGERLFSLVTKKYCDRLDQTSFVSLIFTIFSPSLEQRIKLVHRLIDFDADGGISPDDVKLIMQHMTKAQQQQEIKFTEPASPIDSRYNLSNLSTNNSSQMSSDNDLSPSLSPKKFSIAFDLSKICEQCVKDQTLEDKSSLIERTIRSTFGKADYLSCDQFVQRTTEVSSELFLTLFKILEDSLPLSHFYKSCLQQFVVKR